MITPVEPPNNGENYSAAVYPRRLHYIGAILWPSFLSACIGSMFFFAMFDPVELGKVTTWPIELDRHWGYTIGFFLLWLLTLSASITTWLLLAPGNTDDGENK